MSPIGKLCASLLFAVLVRADFHIPDVLVEVLNPRGFKASIPDVDGIQMFSFHGQINKKLFGREDGTFSKDITQAEDGRWTFINRYATLKGGDKLYYWIRIKHYDGVTTTSYYKDDQTYVHAEIATSSTASIEPPTSVTVMDKFSSDGPNSTHQSMESTCKYTATFVNGRRSCKGELVFEENFDNLHRNWMVETRFAGDPDYEFVIYKNDPDNLFIENGMLRVSPTLVEDIYGVGFTSKSDGLDLGENCTGVLGSLECYQKPQAWLVLPPIFSAQISTKERFSFVYGVVEIRAKLPKGDWIYPELYLKSRNDDYGLGYQSGLLKVAFTPGNEDMSQRLTGGCVLGDSVAARNYAMKSIYSEKNWNKDFHVYRMEWKNDSITLIVDDQIYGNIYPPEGGFANKEVELEIDEPVAQRWRKGSELAPFDKEMYLVLGLGVGGHVFPDRTGKPWNNTDPKAQLYFNRAEDVWINTWSESSSLLVDYIKIWAI